MEPITPSEEAEKILEQASLDIAAEVVKSHAEMTLLAAIARKEVIVSAFMAKAARQGDTYVIGMLMAMGLLARNWSRILADDADLMPNEYLEETDGDCSLDYGHELAEKVMSITDIPSADKVRTEMQDKIMELGPEAFAANAMHMLGIFAEFVRDVLDIKNGDYQPGDGDDR